METMEEAIDALFEPEEELPESRELLTVLRQKNRWSGCQIRALQRGLSANIFVHPHHPDILVLEGGFDSPQIEALLDMSTDWHHEIVEGYENPTLPFRGPETQDTLPT